MIGVPALQGKAIMFGPLQSRKKVPAGDMTEMYNLMHRLDSGNFPLEHRVPKFQPMGHLSPSGILNSAHGEPSVSTEPLACQTFAGAHANPIWLPDMSCGPFATALL